MGYMILIIAGICSAWKFTDLDLYKRFSLTWFYMSMKCCDKLTMYIHLIFVLFRIIHLFRSNCLILLFDYLFNNDVCMSVNLGSHSCCFLFERKGDCMWQSALYFIWSVPLVNFSYDTPQKYKRTKLLPEILSINRFWQILLLNKSKRSHSIERLDKFQ